MQKLSLSWHSRYKSDVVDGLRRNCFEHFTRTANFLRASRGRDASCHRAACCYLDKFQVHSRDTRRSAFVEKRKTIVAFPASFVNFFKPQISRSRSLLSPIVPAKQSLNRTLNKSQQMARNIGKFSKAFGAA